MHSLLTIGQLSKLSGIHIKALRYYESINILKPTYINPQNGYRYFLFATIDYVKLIKICADYGIPLKEFTQFIDKDGQIHIAELLQQAEEKIRLKELAIKEDKYQIEQFKKQINLSNQLDHSSHYHIEPGDEDYFLESTDATILSEGYYHGIQKMILEIKKKNLIFDQRIGIFMVKNEDQWKSFLACKVQKCKKDSLVKNIICLKNSHIHAEHITKDNLENKIKQLSNEQNITKILLLETIEEPYNFQTPHIELRYFI
ncbi:MerR family DNA-binding transcriptional regulator [Streptococcus parauberis]|uniref:Transcriptional regulator n=1 Tax=Streptococcus parauberis KRS-02083 TaxID=1207545 RepID=A0ABP2SXI9_9STRE|nr:MerR family DNA-binding transcriptional regulator [Streptococcus parauberis]AEF25983.1 putative transcriptional regulator [Streptococcus parauberis KCTC 11537]AUT05228.1 Multidrug-efflux transporter 1 regulator [Streptococcus parauberis]EMG24898.1 putative transcriptional regulator [Streptococcus parauberis KRS-02083]MDT2750064.1 MerR family DNA-binding transcriptional regulator [Streptococcus parauberis]PNY18427.1 Multidrug-efflux transporter 1 regulator [Streptococcus parauberis]